MKWIKKGIVFNPAEKLNWAKDTALQPTPILLENKIRVFAGFRDDSGVSRIGWVDLDAQNPMTVLNFSLSPVLDIGFPGAFDDNGVVPTAVVKRNERIFMYYAGYQVQKHVRFIAFTGLAISDDNGNTFNRYKNVPIVERTNEEFLFRAIHTILYDEGKWKAWYGAGNSFIQGEKKTWPVYDIKYMESEDGIKFPDTGQTVLRTNSDEFRIGRPYVIKRKDKYLMFFGTSTQAEPYRLSYAESTDGINWKRMGEKLNMKYVTGEFDSEMSAYPSLIDYEGKTYMFYNGNAYGKEGFGLIILTDL